MVSASAWHPDWVTVVQTRLTATRLRLTLVNNIANSDAQTDSSDLNCERWRRQRWIVQCDSQSATFSVDKLLRACICSSVGTVAWRVSASSQTDGAVTFMIVFDGLELLVNRTQNCRYHCPSVWRAVICFSGSCLIVELSLSFCVCVEEFSLFSYVVFMCRVFVWQ